MAWNLATADEPFQQSVAISNILLSQDDVTGRQGKDVTPIFKVLQNLKVFRDEGKFCDIVIHVNDAQFSAHKAVLAAWSPRLAVEILGKPEVKTELVVQCSSKESFTECLDFMYSGLITVTNSNITHLLQLGHFLLLDSMVHKCEDFLMEHIDSNNFVENYFTALRYNLTNLQERIVEFIQVNITIIIERTELLNLEPPDFKMFITQGKMACLKQEMKFSLVISWVGLNVPDREKYLLHLFDQISWTATVNELLMQISCTQNIFTTNEFCLFQLLHSLVTSRGHHLGPFLTVYPRLYSVYSHMLEDLVRPKIFSAPGKFQTENGNVSISVKCDRVSPKLKPQMKETGVNTDVRFDSLVVDKVNESEIDTGDVPKTKQETPDKVVTFQEGGSVEMNNSEIVAGNTKHRRKSLPRKIPMENGTKEPREKKTTRKPRKSQNKDSKDGKTSEILKKEKNITEGKDIISELLDGIMKESCAAVEDEGVKESVEKKQPVENIVKKDVDEDAYDGDTDDNDMDFEADIDDDDDDDGNSGNIDEDNSTELKRTGIVSDGKMKERGRIKINVNLKRKRRGRPAGSRNSKKREKILKEERPKPRLKRPPRMSEPGLPKLHCTYENCDFTSKTADVLEKHVERVHMIDVELQCHKCEFKTNEMKALCNHVKTHYTQLPYTCEIEECPMTFMRIGLYIRHQMTHMNLKPYKCDLCTKHFASYNQLSCHKKLHEGRQYQCDVCLKRFTTKGVMQQHRMIHFSNKPYLCDTCGFSTKHQSHLISHRKIHTGDVLRCSFTNCTYTTPKQGHMTQHMNSHLNIRNHICQVCGKSFVVRGKLLRHERIHLKEKLYKCKQCDYQTSRTDRMKLHIESHGIKFPKKKFNLPNFEEEEQSDGIDFHQFYEKIQTTADPSLGQSQNMVNFSHNNTTIPFLSMSDMKPIDVINFAANSSMIVDSYNAARLSLDPLGTAASVANMDELQTATNFAQNFDRLQTTTFDQL